MANKTIGELTEAGALAGTELAHIVQAGNSRRVAVLKFVAQLFSLDLSATFNDEDRLRARTNLGAMSKMGSQVFTSSGTFTVPDGVTQIRVRLAGAGGEGNAQSESNSAGANGGDSSFTDGASITMTAFGGGGGVNTNISTGAFANNRGTDGSATGGDFNKPGEGAQGGAGQYKYQGGSAWRPIASSGGNGGYCESLLSVSPGDEFTVTIGAGGTGGSGEDGRNGYCIVEWVAL